MAFIHEHIILPLSDLASGQQVYKHLRLLKEAEQWPTEQLHEFQQQRIHDLLEYVATGVPFYRDWFLNQGIDPHTASLPQMPIVNKNIMRQEGIVRFTSNHFPAKERIASRSSGSTGEPFSFYVSKEADSVNTAAKLRTWYQAGYRLGDRYMKIANGSRQGCLKKIQDKVNNCIYVPFYSMDDEVLCTILDKIEAQKPKFIRSYPIPLYLLARYRNNHSNRYHHHPLHVMTTGSTLPQGYRDEIERAFGCDVIDSYSCEGTPNTYETPAHNGYRMCGYYGIIEVLDNHNQPITNGIGRVVSTDLWNFAHPFIRYDTQDLVEMRGGTIIRIIGRESDTIVSARGTIYTNHNFSHYFTHEIPGVDAYQIMKKRDGSIIFHLVVNGLYTPSNESSIINYWQNLLDLPVTIAIVDTIPLMGNNKRLTIIYE